MKPHGNAHENHAKHHLYEIFDVERDNFGQGKSTLYQSKKSSFRA
jgi:hypothetical protein